MLDAAGLGLAETGQQFQPSQPHPQRRVVGLFVLLLCLVFMFVLLLEQVQFGLVWLISHALIVYPCATDGGLAESGEASPIVAVRVPNVSASRIPDTGYRAVSALVVLPGR
jgi:membrane protein required for beta-lactamase induction